MSLTLIVIAGFYAPARHAIHYADALAQAAEGRLLLLHTKRASVFDPYVLADAVGESYHRDELGQQVNTAAALYQLAGELAAPTTVEVITDLVPEVMCDLATRYAPALFVIGQPVAGAAYDAGVAVACGELLRAGHYPVLAVPAAAPIRPPHRLLVAADGEAFVLAPALEPLRQLLNQLATSTEVVHISEAVEDDTECSAAWRAVRASGLVGDRSPDLRGYVAHDYASGILTALEDARADLVIVLARQRSYLGELFHRSVTARLLQRSPRPVLVLPTSAAPVAAGAAVPSATTLAE